MEIALADKVGNHICQYSVHNTVLMGASWFIQMYIERAKFWFLLCKAIFEMRFRRGIENLRVQRGCVDRE
jgi:hypothetical protein